MAKFKVGDRCIHTDIMGHMDKCIVTKADKPGRYTVEFYLGGEKEVAESSLRKLTNAVRNGYVPLRTKSGGVERVYDGDRVIYKGKEFTAEKLGSPSLAQGILVGDDGAKVTVSLKDPDLFATNAVYACNSTNSIVAKAMNAVARNFTPTSEFEIGDKVRFRDSVRSVPHDETYTVVKVSGKNITIKGGRDNGTSTEFANNLEIVENADTGREKTLNAKFYATGYTNDGANEKQIGPFKTKEDAIKAGREKQGASGTFRFAGVVGEDGTYVYHNAARSRNAVVVKALNASKARNADFPIEKFEVGKIYRAPWDKNWVAKVLSRTDSSIKVAIKSASDKTWHRADEQVTLRINPRKSEEQGAEVAKGWDWEFWADVKA